MHFIRLRVVQKQLAATNKNVKINCPLRSQDGRMRYLSLILYLREGTSLCVEFTRLPKMQHSILFIFPCLNVGLTYRN